MSDIKYFDNMRTSQVGTPPCIGCQYNVRCELDELACRTFAQYAEHNRFEKDAPRFPDKKTYDRVFFEDEIQAKLL